LPEVQADLRSAGPEARWPTTIAIDPMPNDSNALLIGEKQTHLVATS
jgi:hypothetical protein